MKKRDDSPAGRELARGLFSLVLLGLVGCAAPPKPPPPPPPPVVVGPVTTRAVPIELRAVGHVEPFSSVQIRSQVGGQLQKVGFAEGDSVKKGQVLFVIDSRPFKAVLSQARANLERDRVQAATAGEQLKRYEPLVGKELVSREQYDQVRAAADAARAAVKASEAAVETAELQLGYTTISAPFNGRTGNLAFHEGNLIKANDDRALVTINQIQPVNVTFGVPEQYLPEIMKRRATDRLPVTSTLSTTSPDIRKGELTFVDNAVDPTSGSILLKASFPNEDSALWPGLYTNVVLTLGIQSDALVVPSQAIQTGQQGSFVFVVKDDSTVESVPVEVSRTFGQESVLSRGPQPGAQVVTDGQIRITPGARVQVVKKDGTTS